ncbi:MAG TPA: Hsp70 family protein, partial [Gammaproteobacteria bacterium]|nr:Hsp70 family protein [Gammaproteobacteria bacterium]
IHVVQGERKQATQNKSLGRFDLTDIPPSPRGMPQIEVAFDLDANGILNVSAKDKATGKEQSIVIKASGGLSDEEIEQMVKDAEAHSADDKKFEEIITARNTADGLVHATKKTLEEAGDKATEEERDKINAAIEALEEAMKADDFAEIEARTKDLSEASTSLAQKMYAEQQEQPSGGDAEASAESGSDDDDAVDAEFEEVKEEEK